jgi:hypothetical protein
MEVDVTRLINEVDPSEISGSIAERGNNAGPETWANALEATADEPLLTTEDERDNARDFFKGFGAWSKEEIAAWSDNDIDALILQYAAGDLRELQSCAPGDGLGDIDWDKAEHLQSEGTCGGSLYVSGDKLYIYIGD